MVAVTVTDGRITALTNTPGYLQDLQNVGEQGNTYDSAIILTSTDENMVLSGMIKSASEEVAYGSGFSKASVASRGIRLGHVTADTSQGSYSVAMGYQAGQTDQGEQAVAMGWGCGGNSQGSRGIAIGRNSGNDSQGIEAIALGFRTGRLSQGVQGIALGTDAGENTQGDLAVAVGVSAGRTSQGGRSVAIGPTAGNTSQGDNAIAVGFRAGQTDQGEHSVALGTDAGRTSQADNSIVLNATGSTLENTTASSLVVKPVRFDAAHQNTMSYNATTGEITHSENVSAVHFFGNASHLVSTTNVADDIYGGVGNVAAITILDGRIAALTNVAIPAELQDLQNVGEQGNVYDSTMTVGNLVATHNVEALQFLGNASHMVSTTNVADDTYGGLGNVAQITILDGRISSIVNVASPEVQDLQNVCEQGNVYTLEATFGNVATTNVVSTNVSGNGSRLTSTTDVADDTYGGAGNVAAITITDGRITSIVNVQATTELQDLQNVCETGNVYNSAITVTNVLTTNVVSTNVSGNGSGLTSTTDVADETYGGLGNVAQITILNGRVTQIQNVEAPMVLQDLQNTSEQGNTYDSAIQLTSTGNNLVLSGMVYSVSEEVGFGSGFSKANVAERGIRLGHTAVDTAQGQYSISMGYQAGETSQGAQAVAMGWAGGASNQGFRSVAIGRNAGSSDQAASALALGYLAGQENQGTKGVAVGANAGQTDQAGHTVAVGGDAAKTSQGSRAVAVGSGAGALSQNTMAVSVGYLAAQSGQGERAVAVGVNASRYHQNAYAVSLGSSAGQNSQGSYAVAVGAVAGKTSQADNSIVINATGSDLNNTTESSLVVKPVRYDATHQNTMSYNATTGEITHSENVTAVGSITAGSFSTAGAVSSASVSASGAITAGGDLTIAGGNALIFSLPNTETDFIIQNVDSATSSEERLVFNSIPEGGAMTSQMALFKDSGNLVIGGGLTTADEKLVVGGNIKANGNISGSALTLTGVLKTAKLTSFPAIDAAGDGSIFYYDSGDGAEGLYCQVAGAWVKIS